MYDIARVRDAVPGAKSRPPTDADTMLHIHDDGTVTIPSDVEVIELDGRLWFRTPHLRGWNGVHPSSPTMGDPSRSIGVAIREELARTGRTVTRWTQADADVARTRELAYWREADGAYRRIVGQLR